MDVLHFNREGGGTDSPVSLEIYRDNDLLANIYDEPGETARWTGGKSPPATGSFAIPIRAAWGSATQGSLHPTDIAFKYVTIHELGHTFGLCHVDGLLRIMYTTRGKSVWSGSSLWQYWTSGVEAGFVFEEAQRVWQYIVRNFSAKCLEMRQSSFRTKARK